MRSHRLTRAAALVIAAGFLAAVPVGCSSGPPTGEVRGKVTFKGKPVTEGSVTFLNPKGEGDAGADINKDGTYAIPGKVVVGEYLVVITPPVTIVDTDPGKSPPAPVEKNMPDIPRKYRQQGTTTLKATVKEGKNEINLDMT
jgi:hypothetical protein